MKPRDVLQRARELYDAGNLEGAARECRHVLKSRPRHTEALYLLGVIAMQSGNHTAAAESIRQALAVTPEDADCWNILGLALTMTGHDEEAGASFEKAMALGDSPVFANNLGSLRKKQNRLDEAAVCYREAVRRNPVFAQAHVNLGVVHRERQEWKAAEDCFRTAAAADPSDVEAWANLGQVLRILGRSEEAAKAFESALTETPERADLHCDLGDALRDLGQIDRAIAEYGRAVEIDGNLARGWFSTGAVYNSREEYVKAVPYFLKALEVAPEWAAAQHDLGKAVFHLGQVDEALHWFGKAVAGERPELPLSMIALVIPGCAKASQQDILDARRSYARYLPVAEGSRLGKFKGGRALRVGYVSAFFQFPNWMKPVWALVNHHDRRRFEVHLFSDAPAEAVKVGYQRRPQDRFHDISGLSNEEVAKWIEGIGIDVLVDLNGYSKMKRLGLLALRPAPVIAAWFNMYATSGMEAFDYLIGDAVVIPPEEEKFYTEKILRVPGTYLTFEVGYPAPEVAAAPCLKNDGITFGCLASQYKITKEVVAAWSEILRRVPQSRLLLKNARLGSAEMQGYVRAMFRARGISPERLKLEGPADHFEFLKAYDEIDVALDTFPYNGGTTTTEAIWQGVPVVAYWGDRWVARTSATILRAANLGRFVSGSIEEYVSKAVELAGDAGGLEGLRKNMRSVLRESSACDAEGFARSMEALYLEM